MAEAPYPHGGDVATKEAAFQALIAGKKEAEEREVYTLELLSALQEQKLTLEKQQRISQYAIDDVTAELERRSQATTPLEAVKARGKWYVKA